MQPFLQTVGCSLPGNCLSNCIAVLARRIVPLRVRQNATCATIKGQTWCTYFYDSWYLSTTSILIYSPNSQVRACCFISPESVWGITLIIITWWGKVALYLYICIYLDYLCILKCHFGLVPSKEQKPLFFLEIDFFFSFSTNICWAEVDNWAQIWLPS